MPKFKQIIQLTTDNLILRQWKADDYLAFSKLNSDSTVMEYFPNTLSKKQSDSLAKEMELLISQNGWGVWAVEEKERGQFIGCVGLHEPSFDLPFSPCIEIAWRLDKQYWGKGYATEAGNEVLNFAFERLKVDEIVSFTALVNKKSESVMKRLGMRDTQQNFEHPHLPMGHILREHLLYKISKEDWESTQKKIGLVKS